MIDKYKYSRLSLFGIGDVVNGVVVSKFHYGIFIAFENGANGFIDILQLSPIKGEQIKWDELPCIGECIETVVIDIENDLLYSLTLRKSAWLLKAEWCDRIRSLHVGDMLSAIIIRSGTGDVLVNVENRFLGEMIDSDLDATSFDIVDRAISCQVVGFNERFLRILVKQI